MKERVCFKWFMALAVCVALGATAFGASEHLVTRRGYGLSTPTGMSWCAGGGYVYAPCTSTLLVYDVDDTTTPEETRVNIAGGKIEGSCLVGDTLYMAARNLGLLIYDVSDPSNPVDVAEWLPEEGLVRDVAVKGDYAYLRVADATGEVEIQTLDLTTMTVTGVFAPADTNHIVNGAVRVCSTAVVYASRDPNATYDIDLAILDIRTNPDDPTYSGRIQVTGRVNGLTADPSSPYVYLGLGNGYNGVQSYDLTNPNSPVNKGMASGVGGTVSDLCLDGSYLYGAVSVSGTSGTLGIYSLSSGVPTFVKNQATGAIGNQCVAVTGNVAVLGGGNSAEPDKVRAYNVSNKTSPYSTWSMQITNNPEGLYLVPDVNGHDYAYIAAGWQGMWIVDMTDPDDCFELGHADAQVDLSLGGGGLAENIWASDDGDYAYVCEGNYCSFYDCSDKSDPVAIAAFNIGGWQEGVRRKGDYVYFSSHGAGGCITAFDVSDPEDPEMVAYLALPQGAMTGDHDPMDFYVDDGGYIYIAAQAYLRVVRHNLGTPTTFTSIGSYYVQGMTGYPYTEIWDIDKDGDYVFCSSKKSKESSPDAVTKKGMIVFDVSTPSSPSFVTTLEFDDGFEGIWVDAANDVAYCSGKATGSTNLAMGVTAIDISDPENLSSSDIIDECLLGDSILNVCVVDDICYCAGFRDSAPIVQLETSWKASTDYSSTQNYRNWNYRFFWPYAPDVGYHDMTWVTRWAVLGQSPYFSMIDSNWQWPLDVSLDPARVWIAPYDGWIDINSTITKYDAQGDGIIALLAKRFNVGTDDMNADFLWGPTTITDASGHDADGMCYVYAGDEIIFETNCKTYNNVSDITAWDPEIEYVVP